MKYTAEEARAINLQARATLVATNAQMQRWLDEEKQRNGGGKIVHKTVENARAPAPDPAPAPVNALVEQQYDFIFDTVGQAVAQLLDKLSDNFQAALAKRDNAIQALRDEVEVKLSLGRKVARLKAEIAEARAMQPNFEDKLNVLEGRVEKVSKQTSRVRTEQSILQYQQKELSTELSKMKRESAASPSAVVEFQTSTSHIVVGNLHPDAAAALRRFAAEVVDAYDGDPILFSGPAGSA